MLLEPITYQAWKSFKHSATVVNKLDSRKFEKFTQNSLIFVKIIIYRMKQWQISNIHEDIFVIHQVPFHNERK